MGVIEMGGRVLGPGEQRMTMRYGVNQADQCWDFALGPARERIWARLREVDTRMIRLFLFDKGAPDHVKDWDTFAAYVQAVLNVGATPMMTFAKFHPPFDDPWAVRAFADRSADVVRRCVEQWGGATVRDWYWCVWNEPNNGWISDGGLTFEQYRHIYEELAHAALRWLAPHLGERRPLIGGPAVEGFPNFWWDWLWRFVNEIDNALIGFVDWHRYVPGARLSVSSARDRAAGPRPRHLEHLRGVELPFPLYDRGAGAVQLFDLRRDLLHCVAAQSDAR